MQDKDLMVDADDQEPRKRSGWKTLALIFGGVFLTAAVFEMGFMLFDPEGYERARADRAKAGGIGYGSNHLGAVADSRSGSDQNSDQQAVSPALDYREIQRAYAANEISADRRFGKLAMRVTGPVRKINSSLTGKPTIWLGDDQDFLGTMVNLDREYTDYAARLIPGVEITLDCSGARSTLGTVSLQDCRPAS